MPRPKQIDNCVRLSFVVSRQQADRIKYMTLQMSKQQGRLIGVSEAIRMAIEAAYPIPKNQLKLFN